MTLIAKKPKIYSWEFVIPQGKQRLFVEWQAQLNASVVSFEGFISLEFLAKSTSSGSWVVCQRFYDTETYSTWRNSPICLDLIHTLQGFSQDFQEKIEGQENLNGITEVIIAQVDPENEKSYEEWSGQIHQIEAQFEGFRGMYLQRPQKGQNLWITLLQFDTEEHLDRWLDSSERQELLKKSTPLLTSLESHRVTSPFAGWFSSIAKTEEVPSVWKQTMLVLLTLFPVVMVELKLLSPQTEGLGIVLSTFIGNVISVTLLAFPLMPIAIKSFEWWLYPKSRRKWFLVPYGTCVILLLYIIEILIFLWMLHGGIAV